MMTNTVNKQWQAKELTLVSSVDVASPAFSLRFHPSLPVAEIRVRGSQNTFNRIAANPLILLLYRT